MIIIHKIDDFIFELFPQVAESNFDEEVIKQVLTVFYTTGPFRPKITIIDDYIKIEIDTSLIETQEKDYQKAISFSEKGMYSDAKKILERLVKSTPHISEYYRILGQIYSEEGDQDKAVDTLIDALKWDPNNAWALLMMGNIFAKFKNDLETALKYYKQAAKLNPEDNIAINNIGANLMQLGKHEDAREYFNKALKINPEYPNTHYALALIDQIEGDDISAFDKAITAIKKSKFGDIMYKQSFNLGIELAKELISENVGERLIAQFATKVEEDCGRKILILKDNNIATAAKTEIAENHNSDEHVIRYKPNYPAFEHLVMHELMHIDLATQARKEKINELFITNQSQENLFRANISKDVDKMIKAGYSSKSISGYVNSIFSGLNSQVYNTPIDLFIEDRIFREFPALRPFQFISLLTLIQEGIHATTDKKIVELSPPMVLSVSKVYNLVNTLHFRDLFGIDLIASLNPSFKEKKQAEEFWDEFLTYRLDKVPGEEYELLAHWAKDLHMDKYFDMVYEEEYRSKTMEDVLSDMEDDPFGVLEKDPKQDRANKTFREKHLDKDINMAVVMYMVDAMQYFKTIPEKDIEQIAFQIAMIGTAGISPDNTDYKVNLIPEKTFTGYHLLAYYYVSFALALPKLLPELQLPFDKEYQMALTMNK